jgi:hypothetical protein
MLAQPILFVPPDVAAGLLAGKLMQNGSVIRHVSSGRIYKFLDEVPGAEQAKKKAAQSAAKLSPKLVVPAVAAATVVGAAAVVLTRRRRRNVAQAPVPACATRFEEALRAYVEAGQSAELTPATVDELLTSLDELKAWSDEGNAVEVSLEALEPLLRLVINHTPALAAAYSVELDTAGSDDSDGVVVQLREHLRMQKRILGAA